MLYLHDVWVNWFEGEENGYNVCHFHEWRKEDAVELLDQAPVILMKEPLFNYIENQLADLPKQLLEDVRKKAFLRKNHERVQLEHCFVATDGKGVLAVDTMGYTIPVRKSRLVPRQEQLVHEMFDVHPINEYDFEVEMEEKEYHILSLHPYSMTGLTRKERQLKQLLFMALDQLFSSRNSAEIRYWYTEWAPGKYREIQAMTTNEVKQSFHEEVMLGWTAQHYRLCKNLVKGHAFFEKLWEVETASKINQSSNH
ncbi:YjbA family protein [Bacillus xiapuensis]|uniref:YjbA family protein n=1 Tax=Bacillus xiapuensis TaxID=2014075 RepID=UPI000C24C42D|nr:YjbA family protein [Bacillus xiapuensis]